MPAAPTGADINTDGRLVREEVPVLLDVCRYDPQTGGIVSSRTLTEDLDGVPADLAVPPGGSAMCRPVEGPAVPYLARLVYPDDGQVWLATRASPSACEVITNGEFRSGTYVADQIAAALDTAAWQAGEPIRLGGCLPAKIGRAGQERDLVPAGWSQLVLCQGLSALIPTDRAQQIADLLAELPQRPGTGTDCTSMQEIGAPPGDRTLVWNYPSGRSVVVGLVPGCDPPLGNGSTQATATPEQQAELLRLLEKG